MPGYDEPLPIPPHLEPPRLDADETLPSALHPSYPFGRPVSVSKPTRHGVGNLLDTVKEKGEKLGVSMVQTGLGREKWDELGLDEVVESQVRKEVPPGMAGAKRPPSPPSPALRPSALPPPRSIHLEHLYARQRQATPQAPADPFDAPVPNETYTEEGAEAAEGEMEGVEEQEQEPDQGE
ncbi:hypothetical protein M231_01132 [Tremella mesenterica]|uniref:Uncharacterized protein n=1 Tax=Tremella mesenterica TaxID=5217 RepID=A0A4Q1BU55_TREME|nr:hypothetical protein M231_01132 [Tremella mesenterica]